MPNRGGASSAFLRLRTPCIAFYYKPRYGVKMKNERPCWYVRKIFLDFFLPAPCFALQSFARGQSQIDDLSSRHVKIGGDAFVIERQLMPKLG